MFIFSFAESNFLQTTIYPPGVWHKGNLFVPLQRLHTANNTALVLNSLFLQIFSKVHSSSAWNDWHNNTEIQFEYFQGYSNLLAGHRLFRLFCWLARTDQKCRGLVQRKWMGWIRFSSLLNISQIFIQKNSHRWHLSLCEILWHQPQPQIFLSQWGEVLQSLSKSYTQSKAVFMARSWYFVWESWNFARVPEKGRTWWVHRNLEILLWHVPNGGSSHWIEKFSKESGIVFASLKQLTSFLDMFQVDLLRHQSHLFSEPHFSLVSRSSFLPNLVLCKWRCCFYQLFFVPFEKNILSQKWTSSIQNSQALWVPGKFKCSFLLHKRKWFKPYTSEGMQICCLLFCTMLHSSIVVKSCNTKVADHKLQW